LPAEQAPEAARALLRLRRRLRKPAAEHRTEIQVFAVLVGSPLAAHAVESAGSDPVGPAAAACAPDRFASGDGMRSLLADVLMTAIVLACLVGVPAWCVLG